MDAKHEKIFGYNQDVFPVCIWNFQATEGRNAALICRAPRLTQLFPKGNCMIFFLDTCSFLKRAIITKLANWLLRFRQYPVWYLQIWLVGWLVWYTGSPSLTEFLLMQIPLTHFFSITKMRIMWESPVI